jgi:hypothetical protein
MKGKGQKTVKIGRDAATGRFISVRQAQKRKKTSVVETIKGARKK